VKREGKKYALTGIGQMIIKRLEPLVKTVDFIENQEVFWQEHDFSSTEKAFNKIEKEYYDKLIHGLDLKNLSFYILDEDIKLACVVSDIFCSISFFFKGKNDAKYIFSPANIKAPAKNAIILAIMATRLFAPVNSLLFITSSSLSSARSRV